MSTWSDSETERAPAVQPPPPLAAAAAAAAAAAPRIGRLNVSKNSRMHIGPKFIAVTQNVEGADVIKGRVLGLRLEERARPGPGARRLRCSVAVFVCWALVLALALACYAAHLALQRRPVRLDLEVGPVRYLWEWARRWTAGERAWVVGALAALACVGALAGVVARAAWAPPPPPPDVAPHAWNISRRMWLADPAEPLGGDDPWPARYLPLRLVIVQHTAGAECHRFADCAASVRDLQDYYYREYGYDLPYNFMVGNEGRVYEAFGWRGEAAHTRGYNRCSLGIGFMGDYRSGVAGGALVRPEQLENVRRLLEGGVRAGVLHARYVLLPADAVQSTASPGDRLAAALALDPHARPGLYMNRSCDDIYDELRAADGDR